MGRRKKTLPTNGLETITELAERGVTETDIAKALGMSFDTWLRIKTENEEAKHALEAARAIEKDQLVGMLFDKAMKGDSTAAMFLLKTRHGYLEGKQHVSANQVNVQITLPGAKDESQYLKEVNEDE
jgi:hypothetical protein